MSLPLVKSDSHLIVTQSYIQALKDRDKEIKIPKFKNERRFGYIITNEVDLKRLQKYITKLKPKVRYFDTETQSDDNSIRKARIVGLSISFGREKHHNYYIPCGHTVLEPYGEQVSVEKTINFAKWFLLERNTVMGAHNMAYDWHILANHGVHLVKHARRHNIRLYDTMIASWLVDENQLKGLKEQSKIRLKNKPYVPEMKTFSETVATVPNDVKRKHGLKANQKATIDLVAIDIAGDYAINDSLAGFDLIEVYEPILWREQPLWDRFHFFEMDYFITAYKMERRGTKLNLPLLRQYKRDITKHIAELEEQLFKKVGYSFSVNSPKALPKLFYEELGFPVVKRTDPRKNKSGTSNPSTDKEALEMLLDFRRTLLNPMLEELAGYEKKYKKKKSNILLKKIKRLKKETESLEHKLSIVKLVVDIRLLKHLDSNFITGLLQRQIKGIIYPRFNQAGTVTGRLSSSDPNGQNMPNDVKDSDPRHRYSIRDLFIARKGFKLIVADFSNLELRILAHIARDEALINAFLNKEDPHSSTAINMNTSHRLVRAGIEPTELKKLAGMDKVIYNYVTNIQRLYEVEPKLASIVDKYLYGETIKSLCKKDPKEAYKLVARLQKEAKDLRAEGKLFNFAIIYGFGDEALAKSLGLRTAEQGKMKKLEYFRAYKGVARWVQEIRIKGQKRGYVTTLLGKKKRKPTATQASNAPVQGTAGDIVKKAQLKMDRHPVLRRLGFHQLIQVHDEVICEAPEEVVERAQFFMQQCMEHPLDEDLIVPLVAEPETGYTWNQCK